MNKQQAIKIITDLIDNKSKPIPLDNLDGIVIQPEFNHEIKIKKFSVLDGSEIIDENEELLKLRKNIDNEYYHSTDHFFILLTIIIKKSKFNLLTSEYHDQEINHLFVSLDNSVRSNINNEPLFLRIGNICNALKNVLRQIDNCMIYFSESYRPSFMGKDLNTSQQIVRWAEIKRILEKKLKINFIEGRKNNDGELSFGITAFSFGNNIGLTDHFSIGLNKTKFGSACIVVEYHGIRVIFIHFPLDFINENEKNENYITACELFDIMDYYKCSVAFGDFNLVPGNPKNGFMRAIEEKNKKLIPIDGNTFCGSYFDFAFVSNIDNWEEISF